MSFDIGREASRPSMSFVPVKGLDQQALSTLYSAPPQLIGQRPQPINTPALARERARHPRTMRHACGADLGTLPVPSNRTIVFPSIRNEWELRTFQP